MTALSTQTPPSVAGSTAQGSTLTATPGTHVGDSPSITGRQWKRANNGSGSGAVNITGETGLTYVTKAADEGKYIACVEAIADAAAAAKLTTALAGANNDLVFTAKATGTGGNAITVTYVVAGNNTPLSVSVTGNDITVNLATDGSGVATSTAAQVAAAIAASTPANALVAVTNAAGNDGTGTTVALATTHLAGGEAAETGSSTSNWFGPVVEAAGGDVNSVEVDGIPITNAVLTAKYTVDDNADDVAIKWYRYNSNGSGEAAISGAIAPEYRPRLADLTKKLAVGITPSHAATKASLETALTGNNNDIAFTAKTAGAAGNAITIAYVVSGNSTALSVSVSGSAITVNVATDSSGNPTSTASQIAQAIGLSGPASALVATQFASSNNGTGVVTALSATHLAGGTDAATGTEVKSALTSAVRQGSTSSPAFNSTVVARSRRIIRSHRPR